MIIMVLLIEIQFDEPSNVHIGFWILIMLTFWLFLWCGLS